MSDWIIDENTGTRWVIVPPNSLNYQCWIQAEKDLDDAFLHSIGVAPCP